MNQLYLATLVILVTIPLSAQIVRRGEASPIAPEITLYDYPGVVVGVPIVFQQGLYRDTCDCPAFRNGIGSGVMVGVFYEFPTVSDALFRFGVSAGIDYRRLAAQYREQELLTFTSAEGRQRFTDVLVEFRQRMSFDLLALWGQPYVHIVPTEALAFGIGANVGYLVLANATHTKMLTQNTLRLPNGEVVTLQLPNGGNTTTVRDGEMIGVQRFQATAVARLELSVALNEQWRLRPGIQYHVPLVELSSSGSMKMSALILTLSLARRREQ